jgi:hypothetical protein
LKRTVFKTRAMTTGIIYYKWLPDNHVSEFWNWSGNYYHVEQNFMAYTSNAVETELCAPIWISTNVLLFYPSKCHIFLWKKIENQLRNNPILQIGTYPSIEAKRKSVQRATKNVSRNLTKIAQSHKYTYPYLKNSNSYNFVKFKLI